MPKLDRITADPAILGSKACMRGMRIAVSLVVNLVANGLSTDEIIAEYPDLEPEDIRQTLQYAAWAADDAFFVPISTSRQSIAKDNVPLVRLAPVKPQKRARTAGMHKGAMRMSEDFNNPMPDGCWAAGGCG